MLYKLFGFVHLLGEEMKPGTGANFLTNFIMFEAT